MAELPEAFQMEVAGVWSGDVGYDAANLVAWAVGKGGNPKAPRYTTLGSLIKPLLPKLGTEDARLMAVEVLAYSLYRDEALTARPNGPLPCAPAGRRRARTAGAPAEFVSRALTSIGTGAPTPESCRASCSPTRLPGRRVPDAAIGSAASVCAIKLPASLDRGGGTGVLIGKTLVLTNYHVLKYTPKEDLQANAAAAVLRFGMISTAEGQEAAGHPFKLATGQPIVKSSPVNQLDYALLRVEDAITSIEEIKPAPCTPQRPAKGMELNILQHPGGQEMKLALSSNGIVGVYPERGLVQYLTRAAGGLVALRASTMTGKSSPCTAGEEACLWPGA